MALGLWRSGLGLRLSREKGIGISGLRALVKGLEGSQGLGEVL